MAIAFSTAGAGASTETSGATLNVACPATVNANDILIAHIYFEGTTTTPPTPSGWALLSGPHVIETTIGRHWIFGRIADGSEDGTNVDFGNAAVTTMRSGRIYRFTGWVSGTITQNVPAHRFTHQSHATDPQMPTVTTSNAGALAVAAVVQNDNNALGDATGESGGNWVEAVAEYTAALTPGLVLQLQTTTPTSNPGTVSGGAVAATNDPSGVIGFEIRDQNIFTSKTLTEVTETDTAQAVELFDGQFANVSPALETDSVNSVVPLQPFPASETDTAQALTFQQPTTVNLTHASEADTAQALDKDKADTLVHASETDTAQAVSFSQASSFTLVHASEADTAQALVVTKPIFKTIGVASETNTAQTLDADKPIFKTIGVVSETDTAQAVSFSQSATYDLTHAAETDTAVALTQATGVNLVHASETDSANGIVALQPFPALETNSAQALDYEFSSATDYDITPALETDSAQAVTYSQAGAYSIAPATETSSAQAIDKDKLVTLPEWEATPPLPYNTVPAVGDTSSAIELVFESGAATHSITPATETDSAQAVDKDKAKTLTLAAETDTAQVITYSQAGSFSIAPAQETDSATTLDRDKRVTITFAAETDSAQALSFSQPGVYSIVRAQETDSAQTVTFVKPIVVSITHAAETDTAQTLPFGGVYLIEPTTETNVAVALVYGRISPPGYIVGRSTGRIARSPAGRVAKTKQGVLA